MSKRPAWRAPKRGAARLTPKKIKARKMLKKLEDGVDYSYMLEHPFNRI